MQSTAELVSELSQLEYLLRAWSGIDTPGWERRAGVDLEVLRARQQEVREELSSRALDFPDTSSRQPAPPGGFAPEEPDAAALLAAKVEHLERALLTRTLIGQAEGILMERHGITADEAFDVLRHLSMMTNRKLCVIAAELVEARTLPEMRGSAGASPSVPLPMRRRRSSARAAGPS